MIITPPGSLSPVRADIREAGSAPDWQGADGGQRQAELRPDPGVQDRGHQHHLPQYSRPQEPLLPVSLNSIMFIIKARGRSLSLG